MERTELLKQLCFAHGINGDTEEIRALLHRELRDLGINSGEHRYGSVFCGAEERPRKMVIAHLDEVGFEISKIESDGRLRFMPSGWLFPNRLDHALVYVDSKETGRVHGVVFHEEPLKSENIQSFAALYIDIGANSAEEARKLGVKEGQFGTFKKEFVETENCIIGTSIDNRISIFAVLEVLRNNPDILKDTLFIFNTDEETEDHNARGICKRYQPELAVVLDYLPIHQKRMANESLPGPGEGPALVYRGGNYVTHRVVRDFIESKITSPYFKTFIGNTTLPSLEPAFYEENLVTTAVNLCIPARGYHGEAYIVRKSDIRGYVQLINEFLSEY